VTDREIEQDRMAARCGNGCLIRQRHQLTLPNMRLQLSAAGAIMSRRG